MLPPVSWPAHGADNGLVHLTGAFFSEAADGTITISPRQVVLKAWDAPDTAIASATGTTFAFYNLPAGREYFLEFAYGTQTVYSGVTLIRTSAAVYPTTTYEIPVVLPASAQVSGSITREGGAGVGVGMQIEALRFSEASGEFERTTFTQVYEDTYELTELFPGTYVFRGRPQLADSQWSDEFYPDGDHLEDAVPIEVGIGDRLTGIDFHLPEAFWSIFRLAGSDRYATSVEISKATFEPGVPVLYIASGADWPDALSAGPAASVQGGALLLTAPQGLPEVVEAEIRRLSPERVVVVGQQGAVGDAVFEALRTMVPDVSRIGGADRYETSRMIVDDAFDAEAYATVFLATGANFPDALSAGPIAGRRGQPVVLLDGAAAGLDDPTRALLTGLAPVEITLIGGTGVISPGVESSVKAAALSDSVRRLAGNDRYHTNTLLNQWYPPRPYVGLVFIANGVTFPDALAGATSAAAYGASLWLSPGSCLTRSTLWNSGIWDWDRVVLLGGEGALNSDVAQLASCEA